MKQDSTAPHNRRIGLNGAQCGRFQRLRDSAAKSVGRNPTQTALFRPDPENGSNPFTSRIVSHDTEGGLPPDAG